MRSVGDVAVCPLAPRSTSHTQWASIVVQDKGLRGLGTVAEGPTWGQFSIFLLWA